jgi:threonyl-tRNA synthetase
MNQTLHARQTMSLYRYHKSISRAFVGSSHGGGSLSSELSVRSGAKRLIQAAGGFKCRHIDALCDSRPHTEGMRRLLRSTSNSAVEAPTTAEVSADLPQLTLQDLPTSDQSEKMLRVRHSCAHIMAMAVQKLFKGAQCTIGPWIDHGFYYDFDMEEPLTRKSLPRIKKEMQKIIKKKLPFIREEVSAEEARARIEAIGEPYKLEILDSIVSRDPDAPITIYHIGEPGEKGSWWDLCAGPHVGNTGDIDPEAISLDDVAGAYWRGDEKNAQLQRVYGCAFSNAIELEAFHRIKEEAAKRDHRQLGKELDLFSISDDVGGGLVFWHPKGAMVRHTLEQFWKEVHLKQGYQLLYTPHIAKVDLWKTSGHFDFYSESMFDQMDVEDEEYQLKPMNCPFHVAIYKDGYYSYRDLPLRWAELGTVYRYERSGTMHGLFRVRGFTQDDAHIFCLPDQIASEIVGVLDLIEKLLSTFGFAQYEVNLSTRPEKSVGSDDIWKKAESALVEALNAKGWAYSVDEGGGAFYGPKIDIKIRDALGRQWQCSTVQLDFNLPERFDMVYVTPENTKERPIMIHRAILGSLERFMGILIENYAGAFPVWLAPVQVSLLAVTDAVMPYVQEVAREMRESGLRVETIGGMSIGKAIRNAEKSKVPVMCVIGEREAEAKTLSVRTYEDGELGSMSADVVRQRVALAVQDRVNIQF